MAQNHAESLGGWSGEERPIADRVKDYDWDGAIASATAEIARLIQGREVEISTAFWEYYLSLPATAHLRPYFDSERLAREIAKSATYTRTKYLHVLDDAWRKTAYSHATESHKSQVPLPALLAGNVLP